MQCLGVKCLVVLVAVVGVAVQDPQPTKVLMDWILSLQLTNMNALLSKSNVTSVDLGDHTLPGGIVVAKGVRLGDLSTLQVTDHAYMWSSPGNTIQADAFVGLGNMTVTVDSLTFNNQTFPAVFTVAINSLGFHQNLTLQETSCQEIYSRIAFYKLNNVTIYSSISDYNDQDVSEFVQMRVLPYVNSLMQQKPFMSLVQKYMDFCTNLKARKF